MTLTRIPGNQVPVLEANGLMSREWYRFFYNLFQLTGGGSTDITPAELQVEVNTLQTQVGILNGQIVTINGQIVAIQGDIVTLQGQVITIQGDISTIQGQISTIQGQIVTIQGDIVTIQGQIVTIQGDIVTINNQLVTIQNDLDYLSDAPLTEPVNPNAIAQQAQLSYVSTVVDGLAAAIDELQSVPYVPSESLLCYGAFYDTTTQTAAAINTAYAVTFDTDSLTGYGVYRGSPTSQIFVTTPGVYNFQFSAQFDNTSGGDHLAYIWCRINGVDVPYSASQVRMKGTAGELVAAWNFFLTMAAGDYFELMWAVADTAVQITAQAAASPVPAIPSVILTVSQVSSPSSH